MIETSVIKNRKKYLSRIKEQVNRYLGRQSIDIRLYENQFAKEFSGVWDRTQYQSVLDQIMKAKVVFGGDFHAYRQSQRTHVRILRDVKTDRPVILALEIFEAKHQAWIEDYLLSKISEEDFLEKIEWDKKWGFSWSYYKPLLEMAKEKGFLVFGINRFYSGRTGENLALRDRFAAQLLAEISMNYPTSLLYVIYGELHLARKHLPDLLDQEFVSQGLAKPQKVVIFQNAEKIYFKLMNNVLEHAGHEMWVAIAGKKNLNIFCVINSPPWVQWQSYQMCLEKSFDEELEGADNYEEHLISMADLLVSELKIAKINFDNWRVLSQPEQIQDEIENEENLDKKKYFQALSKLGKSFLWKEKGVLYFSRISVNHAAQLIGEMIYSELNQKQESYLKLPQSFHDFVSQQAVAFWISKRVNPQRKTEDVLMGLHKLKTKYDEKVLKIAIQYRLWELKILKTGRWIQEPKIRGDLDSFIEAGFLLGSQLGDKLYRAQTKKQWDLQKILSVIGSWQDAKNIKNNYFKLLKEIEN